MKKSRLALIVAISLLVAQVALSVYLFAFRGRGKYGYLFGVASQGTGTVSYPFNATYAVPKTGSMITLREAASGAKATGTVDAARIDTTGSAPMVVLNVSAHLDGASEVELFAATPPALYTFYFPNLDV